MNQYFKTGESKGKCKNLPGFRFQSVLVLSLAFFLCGGIFVRSVNAIPPQHGGEDQQIFDFIVVGGGTAGCAVASRLSENGKFSVLLLESGGYPPTFLEVPGLAQRNQLNPEVTFQWKSTPQKNAALYNGGIIPISVGRVLGGTSQINYSVFNRGNPKDFDNWANLTGDGSWEYSNLLKYFKKSETYLGEFPSITQHGYEGPIPVSYQEFAPGREVWLEAGRELGLPVVDPNGPQRISFTPVEFSRLFGRRHSSFRGYIEPIFGKRGNLRIITGAHATKVIFDNEGKSAIGVKYVGNGTNFVAFAKIEIILSSGTFGSSTLLMKSGVGPKEVLEASGIPQIKELPVGKNFQDHPIIPIYIILNNKSLSFDLIRDRNPETFEEWRRYGTGPYSSVVGYSGQTFLASSLAALEGHPDWPDIQINLASNSGLLEPFQNNYIAPWETSVRMTLYLGRGKSRGEVKLDGNGDPLINHNFMEDLRDQNVLVEGIRAILKIFEETKTYQKYGARIFNEKLPACEEFHFRSDNYWKCYMRQITIPGNHPVGTCSMGMVVDSKLRVFGIRKLRVVDAGVIPIIPNCNLHSSIYAIAEKASEDILRDNNNNDDDENNKTEDLLNNVNFLNNNENFWGNVNHFWNPFAGLH